jgi:hypothetical protein
VVCCSLVDSKPVFADALPPEDDVVGEVYVY